MSTQSNPRQSPSPLLVVVLTLGVLLMALFHKSLLPDQILFSNDGPLANNVTAYAQLPSAFTGIWQDIHWVGGWQGNAPLNLTWSLLFLLNPILFAKFYIPVTLLILGVSAWLFFRTLGFHTWVCLLGAVATSLNTGFFSYGCWGLGTLPLSVAMFFLALAALNIRESRFFWLPPVLAGFAVGMGIMEGFDVGAILSLFIAAFLVFQTLTASGSPGEKVKRGLLRLAILVVFSAFVSAQTLSSLISTQVQGIAGLEKKEENSQQQWDWATQWSLPKSETFRLFIAGLYGYRLDTPDGGEYWGAVGRTPGWETTKIGMARHSGSGFYAGVLVVVVALWAAIQSLRRSQSIFKPEELKWIWFWLGVAFLSLLLSWGRHFFLYRLFYELPFFSTIRNPIKFLHSLDIAMVILFAYGLHGLFREYVTRGTAAKRALGEHLQQWWSGLKGFDRKWMTGSGIALAASVLIGLIYFSTRSERINALYEQGFAPQPEGADPAAAIVSFGNMEYAWFVGFFIVSLLMIGLIKSRWLVGRRSWMFAVLPGLILAADLSRANLPWIRHYDYMEKYAPDALSEFLGKDAYENRVTVWPTPLSGNQMLMQLQQIYYADWLQNQFPYHNIPCLEYSQESRVAEENAAFRLALMHVDSEKPEVLVPWRLLRKWQLTSTRYVLGMQGAFVDLLNQQIDPELQRFSSVLPFTLTQAKPGGAIKSQQRQEGPYALVEFKGALPRAGLYTRWQSLEDDNEVLKTLASQTFDPTANVLISGDAPPPPAIPMPHPDLSLLNPTPRSTWS